MLFPSLKVQFYILEGKIKEVVENQNQIMVTNSRQYLWSLYLFTVKLHVTKEEYLKILEKVLLFMRQKG